MSALLEVSGLKKYFNTRQGVLHAVDGVNFSVERKQTLGVVGESGCGKSTLGRVILHLLERTEGKILFDGEDISDVTPPQLKKLRREMQMIFQDPFSSLNPRKTVESTIGEPLKIYNAYSGAADYEKQVHEVMETVGLARRVQHLYPHELDGGRRQRVGIARALVLRPKFIVCDEPVSALDVSIQAQILNLMQDLQEQRDLTYIFITHNLSVVKHISDDIMVMYLGASVEKCAARELFRTQYHPYTKALLSAIPLPTLRRGHERIILKGEITSPINIGNKCRFSPRCQYAEEICRNSMPELAEVEAGHWVACHFTKEINGL